MDALPATPARTRKTIRPPRAEGCTLPFAALLIAGILPAALAAGCGQPHPVSSVPFATPYYGFKAQDTMCSRGFVVDADYQLWTASTCGSTPFSFAQTGTVMPAELGQFQAAFAKLPAPNATCPAPGTSDGGQSVGGEVSGSAFPLNDGLNSSEVTLTYGTSTHTEAWIACQDNGQFVPPFTAVAVLFTDQP